MDKKKIKLLLLGIVFVLIVKFALNIVKINCEYRQAKNVSIPINTKEKVNDSLAMTVIDAKLLNMEESTAEYGNDIVDEEDDVEFKTICVEVEFENLSDKEIEGQIFDFSIESNVYSNGISPEMYGAVNNGQNMYLTLGAKEKKKVYLTYVLYCNQFGVQKWNKLDLKDFYIVKDRYPVKTKWKLK